MRRPHGAKFMVVFVVLALLVGLGFGGKYGYDQAMAWHYKKVKIALIVGAIVGYDEGVFSCPCWEREGNICSLCQIHLEGTGQFKRIK